MIIKIDNKVASIDIAVSSTFSMLIALFTLLLSVIGLVFTAGQMLPVFDELTWFDNLWNDGIGGSPGRR